MKRKGFLVFVLCLILMFIATTAYADEGKRKNGGDKEHKQSEQGNKYRNVENDENDDDEYEENDGNYNNDDDEDDDCDDRDSRDNKNNKDKKNKENQPDYTAVTDITLNKTGTTIAVGSWESLTATVQPADATDKKVFWFSGNPQVAAVNQNGKVTGLTQGTAVIYAATRDGFKTDSCTVTVTGSSSSTQPVSRVNLNKTAMTMNIDDTQRLTATVSPTNAHDKAVTWSSNKTSVATVDQNGYVHAVDNGTAVITARTVDGGKTASCTVTVNDSSAEVHVTSVAIVKTAANVNIMDGAEKRLDIKIMPEDATNQNVTWSTSDAGIVTIDQSGNINGVHEGTATITVTTADGSKKAACKVKVIPAADWISVTGVTLNLVNTTIPVGSTDKLRYTIEPADASDKEVRWSSSDPDIVSVDQYGTIEAIKTGTVVITATTLDGGETDSCFVIAVPEVTHPAQGILLNKTASTMVEGETDYLTVIFYPANKAGYHLTWTSGNTAVASVDQNGKVTAKGSGTTVITVKTSNNWSASYTVTVE